MARCACDRETAAERFEPFAHAGETAPLDDFAAATVVTSGDRQRTACRLPDLDRELVRLRVSQCVRDQFLNAPENCIATRGIERRQILGNDEIDVQSRQALGQLSRSLIRSPSCKPTCRR